jgi:hypothetical protein
MLILAANSWDMTVRLITYSYTKCSGNLDGTLIILQSPISDIILNADSTAGRQNMPALQGDMKNNHEH